MKSYRTNAGRAIARARAGAGPIGKTGGARTAYFNGEMSPFLVSLRPALREHAQDVQAAWQLSAARAIHFIQNSGFIRGVVDTSESFVVGPRFRLSARPRGILLGWGEKQTSSWGRLAEALFEDWAETPANCDVTGKFKFTSQLHAAYRGFFGFGEIVSLFPSVEGMGGWSTKLRLVPPSRMKSDNNDMENIVQGVRLSPLGRPLGYLFRSVNPIAGAELKEIEITAEDRLGRPNVKHIFDPEIGAVRGISPLAPIIKVMRQVDQFADAALTKALISTIFAASLRTGAVGESAFDGLLSDKDLDEAVATIGGARGEWYDGAKIDFTQHGRIAHLFPGDELEFHQNQDPAPQFDMFMQWMFREIAKCAGLTYENATGDYRNATYSSVRMGGAMEWLTITKRRSNIIAPLAQAAYEMVLEEAVFDGRLPFPGGYEAFRAMKSAACFAEWMGPARPQADDFKTAKAFEVRKNMGIATVEEIAAEYGQDWDTMLRQQARENALAHELKLPMPHRDMNAIPDQNSAPVDEGNANG